MITRYAEGVIRFRWLTIVATLFAVATMVSGLRFFSIDTDYRVFFDEDNPQLKAFDALQNTYDKSDNVMLMLTPEQGGIFTKPFLSTLEWATNEAWQTPFSTRVDSITNYQHTRAIEDDLDVADLVRDAQSLSAEQLAYVEQVALTEPQLVQRLAGPAGDVAGLNITVQLPGKNATEGPEIVAFVRDLAAQIEARNPNIEVRLTGIVMMNNAFDESSQNDMATLIPLMFLVVIVVLGLLLRSISATIATVVLIFMCILGAMGLFFWAGFKLTPPVASAPTIILTMAVADAVHLLTSFLWGIRHGQSKHQAMVEAIRINFQPIFITSITTALGFLSMNFSEVPPLAHLGNAVAVGVMLAFVLSVSFLPALVYVLPVSTRPAPKSDQSTRLEALSRWVIQRRRALLWSVAGLSVVMVAFVPQNQINDEFVKYFDESVAFRADSDYAAEHLIGPYTIEYSIESGESNGIADPDYLTTLQAFVDHVKTYPEVSHVQSLTDIMKRLNKNLHGDDDSWYRLPDDRSLAAQYLLLYEMSLPYGLDLNNQIDIGKSSTRITITTVNLSSQEVIRLENAWNQWLNNNASAYSYAAASPNLMFAHIGQSNSESLLGGTVLALFLISMILIIALRSVKIGLLSLVPNLVPVGIGFGLWAIMDGMVGMSLSVVAGMTLGIVVDDTVHFLSKYLRARREKGYSSEEAVTYAFTHVGQALIVTTFVLIAGFMVLTFSTFKMNADMGLLTAITIGIALFIDFFLLPPLLMAVDKTTSKQVNYESMDAR